MNYWPAETTNLAECHEPLFALIERLAVNGRTTARVNYGANGWVSHHNADLWCQTGPVGNYGGGDPKWANWPMSAGWLGQHPWEHYAFGRDPAFLRERAWPVMKGAAEFYLDWLVEDAQGHLVTAPGTSPNRASSSPMAGARASPSLRPWIWPSSGTFSPTCSRPRASSKSRTSSPPASPPPATGSSRPASTPGAACASGRMISRR